MNLISYEIIIPVLTFLSVIFIGASVMISRTEKKKALERRLRDGLTAGDKKTVSNKKTSILNFAEKIGNLASHGNASAELWEQLVRAGYFNKSAPAIYTGIKLLLFVVGLVISAVLVVPLQRYITAKLTLIFLGGVILFFIPNMLVLARLRKRHNEICRYLPEAIDLLEICVSSGIGLEMAWNMVADEIKNVSLVLANAMSLANFEIHLGASRIEAMRNMAKRTGVDALSSLAAILVQTERFGTSVADTLRVFAQSMREERSFAAQESAEKMAVRLIVPLVLFIFPAILITSVGPAVLTLSRVLTAGN